MKNLYRHTKIQVGYFQITCNSYRINSKKLQKYDLKIVNYSTNIVSKVMFFVFIISISDQSNCCNKVY